MQKNFWLSILVIALPVALQVLLQAFLGMADVTMVAELGNDAVAAVGLSAKLHFLILVLMIGVASSGGVLTSQYVGAKDFSSCKRTVAITLYVGTLLALPFILLFGLSFSWLHLINPDDSVVSLGAKYLQITAPVLFVTQVVVVYEATLRSLGITWVPLAIGTFAVVLNIFFNYVFIYGHFGFPALGVEGAAWGTLISRLLQLVVLLVWLYGSKNIFALKVKHFLSSCRWEYVRDFVAFSQPVVLNHGIWALGNSVYHVATGFAGTHALAVMGAMVPIESAFLAIFIGLANACSVLIGQSLGADEKDQAWNRYKKPQTFCMGPFQFSVLWFVFV